MSDKPSPSANVCLGYATCADIDEARRIGMMLVEGKFCACVNLLPMMHSIYVWEGTIAESDEVVLLAKTTSDLCELTVNRIVELHSYECPAVVVLPVCGGSPEFLQWVGAQVTCPEINDGDAAEEQEA